MASIVDVAAYIVDRYHSLSTMKLQKLVFYSQAQSLATTGTPLFDDDFEAWRAGPVAPALFDKHRGLFLIDSGHLHSDTSSLSEHQRHVVDDVCDHLGQYTGSELSARTHAEQPWCHARHDLPPSAHGQTLISKTAIRDYYTAHPIIE